MLLRMFEGEEYSNFTFGIFGRRELIQAKLAENETLVTLTSFPRLGAPESFTVPHATPRGPVAQSLYLPDEIINQHIRFP